MVQSETEQASTFQPPAEGIPEHASSGPFTPNGVDEDTFLRERLGGKSAAESEALAREAAESGTAKPGSETLALGEEEGAGPDGKAAKAEEKAPTGLEATAEYAKARKALERLPAGAGKKLLEKLTAEEIVEMGLPLAAQQADQDRLGNKLAKAPPTEKEGEAGESQAQAAEPEQSDDPRMVNLDELTKPFEEDYGTEFAGHLSQSFKALSRAVEAELAPRDAFLEGLAIDMARSELRERFPVLKDAEKWAAVRAKLPELARHVPFAAGDSPVDRATSLMETAAHILYGQEIADSAVKKAKDARRRAGSPVTGVVDQGEKKAQFKSQDEQDSAYLAARMKTGSHTEGLRAAGLVG